MANADNPTWCIPIQELEPGINTLDIVLMTKEALDEEERTRSNGHENGRGKQPTQKGGVTVFKREEQ